VRTLSLSVFLWVLIVSGTAILAQTEPLDDLSECDLTALASAITNSLETTPQDDEALDATLGEIANAIARVRAACAGFSFEGRNAKLIGPITLEEGRYRVRVTTPGFFSASLEVLDGTCDAGIMGLFNLFQGQATDGAEALLTSNGCETLINTQNVTDEWTLTIERLG